MFWLLLSIFLGALGQLFLKIASDSATGREHLVNFYCALAMNYNLWLGFICYGLSFLIWMRILALYDLSYARPMVGLGYIMTVILAIIFLGEKVTIMRWIGILLTVAGIIVLNISSKV
jgi:multidrug transporter EmrE-like cation transporter